MSSTKFVKCLALASGKKPAKTKSPADERGSIGETAASDDLRVDAQEALCLGHFGVPLA